MDATEELAQRLNKDGFSALPYNGKMASEDKTKNQEAFLSDQVRIMVATNAFGMGVDKKMLALSSTMTSPRLLKLCTRSGTSWT